MAAKIVFVFILSVLFRESLSLPISLDLKTVQSTDSLPERVTERTSVLSSETILSLEEDKLEEKLVQKSTETLLKAFESFEADHGKRIKRANIKPLVLCPGDRFKYGMLCLTKEEYKNYNDGESPEDSDDYEEEG